MRVLVVIFSLIFLFTQGILPLQAGDFLIAKGNKELKIVSQNKETSNEKDLIRVNVKNDFDEEIQVQLDNNRKYPLAPHEKITIGKRPPGKYTLTIYNKKGEFVDNITKHIEKDNKWDLNEKTVSNSKKITGLSTGQKVAITAGSLGAIGLGAAIINKAKESNELPESQYVPPPPAIQYFPDAPAYSPPVIQAPSPGTSVIENAFREGGKAFKFLNTKYDEVTVVVEDVGGSPIGSNWVISKARIVEKSRALTFNGEEIKIGPEQKIHVITPDGYQLQRYAFELQSDPIDGNYVWVIK